MASPKSDETQILVFKKDRELLKKISKQKGVTMKWMFGEVVSLYNELKKEGRLND